MDDQQFDSVTAAIGAATARRGMFAALLGGALAIVGAETLAQDLGVAQGDGDECDDDDDCGRGLFCKRVKKRKKNGRRETTFECRYIDGCGENKDFCFDSDDCCGGLRCNRNRERCE